ncbi:MAG: flagellar hook-length control protein FliK [Lachnospiraceae bacterium]|nr:flagellar hook-length control protein FliK [Lachnospiraceae bacterium]
MAEIQMVQLKGQTSGMSRKTKESSGVDFSGMLKEVGQTSSKKDTAKTVDEEAGKNTEQNKVQESDKDRSQAADTEKENTDKVSMEETDSTQEHEVNGLTGAEMAILAQMLGNFSQNVQHSQSQSDEVQALEEAGAVLTEEENNQLVLMDMAGEMDREQEAQPFMAEGVQTAVYDEQQVLVQQTESHMEVAENDPLEENALQEEDFHFAGVKQSDTERSVIQSESAVSSDAELSGVMMTQSQPTDHAISLQTKTDTTVLKTSEDTLQVDLSKSIAEKLISRDTAGTLEVTLEPATLGKITIKLMYEDGKAALSLISDNPKTLEILSQRAGEIAQILEEKTGQTTVVYTPESPYPEQDMNQQKGQEGHQQEQKEHSSKEHAESFAQQLRLGLI